LVTLGPLTLIYTSSVNLAFLLGDTTPLEKNILSFQIAITSDSNKYELFSHPCKYHLEASTHKQASNCSAVQFQ